ncbi:C4-dicarboxylate ABC transporter [Lacicoccus alkaliphilus]|uniref:Uncharacterized protein n=1 Tax=Lacicoccus alkaliphilus DSM 16010 TaxID=1123231 RepID=A0A1M7ASJ1_9BACL|nr:C4-dicarboxylate ABC transporter [Salinicoccus alkaliphilus]SHL45645.1 hypothetical protein SAMN02745189_00240 [Salinicoccus alkaliphilus DSM 16010]
MSEHTERQSENSLNNTTGLWVGWIGIILGLIGFFWQPVFLGIAAIILGILGLFSPQKALNGVALAIGVIALIYGIAIL